jgi:hypothetical protein
MLACLEGRVLPKLGPFKDRSSMDKSKLASTHTDEINAEPPTSPILNPEDLIGQTFLMDEQ